MNENSQNRRNEKRLHLPDLQIKVKKHGVNESGGYVDCSPVDISFNGLAFSAKNWRLELLQKIDIRVSFGHKVLEGTAVVCHIEKRQQEVQYGVLYIDISPTLEETFSLEALSSTLVKGLATNMADNAILGSSQCEEKILLRKAQVFLFDAISAFKIRLSELVEDKLDEHGKIYKLEDLFEFHPSTLSVTIPIKNLDNNDINRRIISPVLSHSKVVYERDDGSHYASILEVLQELSDTFEWILSE